MFRNMEKYIPRKYWEDLMFMGNYGDVSAYKHYMTRNYIYVDNQGTFYEYKGNSAFDEINKEQALKNLA